MNELNKKDFKQIVLDNGFIHLDGDGEVYFVVTQINTENFKDISPIFKQQLEDEGKYNSWINFISYDKLPPYTIKMLPIYGNAKKYVTKWFTNTAEGAVDQGLRDKQIGLLDRANKYRANNL